MTTATKVKKGQKFNAKTRRHGNVAIGCPCRCVKADISGIHAIDKDGNERFFLHVLFKFEILILEKKGQK